MFPQHLSTTVEHLFDAKNKRVSAMKLVRYRDLIIEQKTQQIDLDPIASGRCLAEAHLSGAFELPLDGSSAETIHRPGEPRPRHLARTRVCPLRRSSPSPPASLEPSKDSHW